jgi:RNA polymerase sigma-70 factor (ECF subfamily)
MALSGAQARRWRMAMTAQDDREALEQKIRTHFDAGDMRRAATELLRGYGREILGFLIGRLRDRGAAAEAFSLFTEDLWKGLEGFRWQSSARVWAYALARHAASRHNEDAQRRRKRHQPLSRAGPLSAIEQKIRTTTFAAARTDTRSRIARLRESLPIDEQTILILRVNRNLDWKEIAQVMTDNGVALQSAALAKEAARLRKRYQLAKDKLRRMAQKEGLLAKNDD